MHKVTEDNASAEKADHDHVLQSHIIHLASRRNFLGGNIRWKPAGTVCRTDLALEAISPQSLGEYTAERQVWVGAVSCVCARVCEWDTEKEVGCVLRERLGWFCYASRSQYECRLEDVWFLWLAVPCVTAFKNTCQEKCLLYRLWLPDAGDNGSREMERCVQSAI